MCGDDMAKISKQISSHAKGIFQSSFLMASSDAVNEPCSQGNGQVWTEHLVFKWACFHKLYSDGYVSRD